MAPIPVLMYHHVKPEKDMVSITPEHFEEQIKTLAEMGFHFYSIEDFTNVLTGSRKAQKGLLLTFDDGFVDNWIWAYPILVKYNARATIFITPGRMEKKGVRDSSFTPAPHRSFARNPEKSPEFITHEEMNLMHNHIDFQSHTMTHLRCSTSNEMTKKEIQKSKAEVEHMTSKPCTAFAWPYGTTNKDDALYLSKCGYTTLFTIKTGVCTTRSNPLAIARIEMKDKGSSFVRSRMRLYRTPLIGPLYAAIKGILLLACMLCIPQSYADTLTFKDATTQFGIITHESENDITLITATGSTTYAMADIKQVNYDYEARFYTLDSDDLEAHRTLAELCKKYSMLDELLIQYKHITTIEGSSPEVHKEIALVHTHKKQYLLARKHYQTYWDLTGKQDPEIGKIIDSLAKYETSTPVKITGKTPSDRVKKVEDTEEGLEEKEIWKTETWGNPAKIAFKKHAENKVVEFFFEAGKKGKAVASIALNADLRKNKKLTLSLFNTTGTPLRVSIAFTAGDAGTWHESKEFRLGPKRTTKKTISLTSRTFKTEEVSWQYRASIQGKKNVKSLYILVYNESTKGMIVIDSVLIK